MPVAIADVSVSGDLDVAAARAESLAILGDAVATLGITPGSTVRRAITVAGRLAEAHYVRVAGGAVEVRITGRGEGAEAAAKGAGLLRARIQTGGNRGAGLGLVPDRHQAIEGSA